VTGNWESTVAVIETSDLNTWDLIKAKLAERIAPQEYQNWVMRTALESLDGGSLRVQVPDQVTKEFIEQEYTEQIHSTIRELNLPVQHVVYLPSAESRVAPEVSGSSEPVFASAAGQLNTRFRSITSWWEVATSLPMPQPAPWPTVPRVAITRCLSTAGLVWVRPI